MGFLAPAAAAAPALLGSAGAAGAGAAGAGAAGAGAGAGAASGLGAAGLGAGEATGFGAGNTAATAMPLWNPSGALGAGAASGASAAGGQAGKGTGIGGNMMKGIESNPVSSAQGLMSMGQGFMPHASGGAPQMQFSRGQPGQPLPTMSAQPSIPSLLSQHQGGSQQALQLQQLLKQLGMR